LIVFIKDVGGPISSITADEERAFRKQTSIGRIA
jgi:hypothetical protein